MERLRVPQKSAMENTDNDPPVATSENDVVGGMFDIFDGASGCCDRGCGQVDGPISGKHGSHQSTQTYCGHGRGTLEGSQWVWRQSEPPNNAYEEHQTPTQARQRTLPAKRTKHSPFVEQHGLPRRISPQVHFDLPNEHATPLPNSAPPSHRRHLPEPKDKWQYFPGESRPQSCEPSKEPSYQTEYRWTPHFTQHKLGDSLQFEDQDYQSSPANCDHPQARQYRDDISPHDRRKAEHLSATHGYYQPISEPQQLRAHEEEQQRAHHSYGCEYFPCSFMTLSHNPGPIPQQRIHRSRDMPYTPAPYIMTNLPMHAGQSQSALPTYPTYNAYAFQYCPPFYSSEHVPHGLPPWQFPPYLQPPYLIPTPNGMIDPRTNTVIPPWNEFTSNSANRACQKACSAEHLQTNHGSMQTVDGRAMTSNDSHGPDQIQNSEIGGDLRTKDSGWGEHDTQTQNVSATTSWDDTNTQHDNSWNQPAADDPPKSNDWESDANGTGPNNSHNPNVQHTAGDSWMNEAPGMQQQQQHPPVPTSPPPPPPSFPFGLDAAAQGLERIRTMYGPYGPWKAAGDLAMEGLQPDAPEEPRYDLPQWYAEDIGSTKQVVSGPGFIYYKKSRAPEYIDSLAEPYARFVFKYRTKDELKKEFGIDVEVEQNPDQPSNDLEGLDKQILIDRIAMYERKYGKLLSPKVKPLKPAVKHEQTVLLGPAPPDRDFLDYNLPDVRPTVNKMNATPDSAAVGNPKNTPLTWNEPAANVTGNNENSGCQQGNDGKWTNVAVINQDITNGEGQKGSRSSQRKQEPHW